MKLIDMLARYRMLHWKSFPSDICWVFEVASWVLGLKLRRTKILIPEEYVTCLFALQPQTIFFPSVLKCYDDLCWHVCIYCTGPLTLEIHLFKH